jgi:hypothetical protein
VNRIWVSNHAIQRYRERVADLSTLKIVAALSGPAFETALAFRCNAVKLPTGHRAVLSDNGEVLTVLPQGVHVTNCRGLGMFQPD